MIKMRGLVGLASVILLSTPMVAAAQEESTGASSFVNSLSLWGAVIIGIIASVMVLANSRKMKGGIFGSVLVWFGAGMLVVVLGFLVVVVPPWAPMAVIMRTHDIAFIIGYLFMAYGAKQLLNLSKGT